MSAFSRIDHNQIDPDLVKKITTELGNLSDIQQMECLEAAVEAICQEVADEQWKIGTPKDATAKKVHNILDQAVEDGLCNFSTIRRVDGYITQKYTSIPKNDRLALRTAGLIQERNILDEAPAGTEALQSLLEDTSEENNKTLAATVGSHYVEKIKRELGY